MANIYQLQKKYQKSFEFHRKEEQIINEFGDQKASQIAYGNQALLYRTIHDYQKALVLHQKENALCELLGYFYYPLPIVSHKESRSKQRQYGERGLKSFPSFSAFLSALRDSCKIALWRIKKIIILDNLNVNNGLTVHRQQNNKLKQPQENRRSGNKPVL